MTKTTIMKKVYLDYAATTPMDKKVLKAMQPYFSEKFGNPMSLHSFGREASEAIGEARKQTADFFHCDSSEIIFTSGATESNNLAIKGVINAYYSNIRAYSPKIRSHSRVPHIITTAFEHHCVLNACKSLEKEKLAEITYLPVYKNGVVKAGDVKKAIRQNTILVSVMYVNNEIGTVQPIAQIGRVIKNYKLRTTRLPARQENQKLFFHTDATQAVNYFNCDVKKLEVDLLSLSGHKIYGPKGIGALYIKKGMRISQIQSGGDQEFGKRAGTHNVSGIIGLAQALVQVKSQKPARNATQSVADGSKVKSIISLRNYLIEKVLREIPDSWLNGDKIKRSPNNANFGFENIEGESLILILDTYGIATSTGSACSSGTLEPSHVLLSLGLRPEDAHGSLRITLGKYTTKKEIEYFIKTLKEVVKKLRSISGDVLKEFK
jgi:cysteine desulfurase